MRYVVLSSGDVYRNYDGLQRRYDGPPDPTPLSEDAPLREQLYPYRDKAAQLGEWAKDIGHAPESRLLAGAKAVAIISSFGNARQKRPGITAEYVQAVVAGLNSEGWRSPDYFGTLVDAGQGAVKREKPLE